MNKTLKGFLIGSFAVVLLLAIIVLIPLAREGAAVAMIQSEVIPCSNLIFSCSENDCSNQCAKHVSSRGGIMIDSYTVNNGKGCKCAYQ